MNAVVAIGSGQSNTVSGPRRRGALSLLIMGLAGPGAWALESETSNLVPVPSTIAGPDQRGRLQLELSASSLPRFDNTDGSTRASRIDMTWLPPRPSALGLSLGMTSTERPAYSVAAPFTGAAPSVDLGLHWRYTLQSNYRIDVRAWRRIEPPDALTLVQLHQPNYGARVEMQIGSLPKSGFVADRGFLGLQLESGARVMLRRSGGKPMIYYRTKF